MDGVSDQPAIRTLSTRVVYQNPWLTLREDEIERQDGSRGIYSVIDKPDFAVVIPMADGGFHLVEQYRYPLRGRYWEFPQGAFPQGRSGTPEELAAAELAEETGFTARNLDRLGYLNSAHGYSGQGFHVFLATDLTPGPPQREVEEQDMRQQWFPRDEVERMLRDGIITDDSSLAAYLLLTMRERDRT
ncbi:ADP-ribose pyrophosphatase [Actinophytocola xanthii]|uniref:ADP-ribose pyrophosphatase n=1 Tax=Actinophytocola xanthii TaxID=1912961 RepID=A0A1Q8CX76_9PSEU|nr:ADP-ribose pyrophosphatase [Actinophytocola xanthii]